MIEITSYAHASKLNCEKLCCGGEHPGVEEDAPGAKTYDGGAPDGSWMRGPLVWRRLP